MEEGERSMTPADRTRRILREVLGVSEDQIKPEATMESLRADSLDVVEIIMTAEEEFDIVIPDDEVEACTTVAQWINLIADKTGEAA